MLHAVVLTIWTSYESPSTSEIKLKEKRWSRIKKRTGNGPQDIWSLCQTVFFWRFCWGIALSLSYSTLAVCEGRALHTRWIPANGASRFFFSVLYYLLTPEWETFSFSVRDSVTPNDKNASKYKKIVVRLISGLLFFFSFVTTAWNSSSIPLLCNELLLICPCFQCCTC